MTTEFGAVVCERCGKREAFTFDSDTVAGFFYGPDEVAKRHGWALPPRGGGFWCPGCVGRFQAECEAGESEKWAEEKQTRDTNTAPADSPTKPAACGACGAKESYPRDHVRQRRGTVKYQWQQVCIECWAAGPLRDTKEDAALAWDAMWAPRAGEATEYVMGRIQLALKAADDDCNYLEIRDERGPKLGVFIKAKRAVLALAELGLAGGEGRG